MAASLGTFGCGFTGSGGWPSPDAGAPDAGADGGPVGGPDADGDGIPDAVERGEGATPLDTDGDGTPDYRDLDSDDDRILDRHEGLLDVDRDGVPSFRDLDSDGDGFGDRAEAGDDDLETPPVACPLEVDPRWREHRDGLPPVLGSDGLADFVDVDRDNDGLGDAEEFTAGTALCAFDTDQDGFRDLVEVALARLQCDAAPETCECATDPACGVPETDFFVILPFGGDPIVRPLAFSTAIDAFDVALLFDVTRDGSAAAARALGGGFAAFVAGVEAVVDTPWFGAVAYEDFPFQPYGAAGDSPFRRLTPLVSPANAALVASALRGLEARFALRDEPDGHVEALRRVFDGRAQRFTATGGDVFDLPASPCEDGRRGAMCFREGTVPLVVQFATSCPHEGPPEADDGCGPYEDIAPAPARWADAVEALEQAGARYVGVHTGPAPCDPTAAPDRSACHFLLRTAEASETVEVDGTPVVAHLPGIGDAEAVAATVAGAVERVATRVPYDVDTVLRDDPSDELDARPFVRARRTACTWDRATDPVPAAPCWDAAPGFSRAESLALVDDSTFFDVLPRARVRFDVTFANLEVPPRERSQIAVAFIDLRSNGGAVLDTRQVYVLVPAGEPADPR